LRDGIRFRLSALSARNLGAQRIETLGPEAAEVFEPLIDRVQRLGVDRVNASSPIGPNRREPVLAQHPEVLGHGGLTDPELRADLVDELAGRAFSVGEQLEQPAAHRIAEDIEGVH
jgi:hypothetical protein